MRPYTKVFASLIPTVLTVATLAPVAQAQRQSFAARVNVPFTFETVSGQHFQPGVYTITVSGAQIALIQGAAGTGLALVAQMPYSQRPVAHGEAVFAHYGDRYYLRSISVAGNATQLWFNRSKAERRSQVASETSQATIEMAVVQTGR